MKRPHSVCHIYKGLLYKYILFQLNPNRLLENFAFILSWNRAEIHIVLACRCYYDGTLL